MAGIAGFAAVMKMILQHVEVAFLVLCREHDTPYPFDLPNTLSNTITVHWVLFEQLLYSCDETAPS